MIAAMEGCAVESVPEMTLWRNFFPEPEVSFYDLPL